MSMYSTFHRGISEIHLNDRSPVRCNVYFSPMVVLNEKQMHNVHPERTMSDARKHTHTHTHTLGLHCQK